MTHSQHMNLALSEALKALQLGEVPIGALVVSPTGHLTYGYNCPIEKNDPTAHAEIIAMRKMAQHLGNYRLTNCILYVTLQPCLMCSGAIDQSRIRQVYYGATENKCRLDYKKLCRFKLNGPILEPECQKIILDFFNWRRFDARHKK